MEERGAGGRRRAAGERGGRTRAAVRGSESKEIREKQRLRGRRMRRRRRRKVVGAPTPASHAQHRENTSNKSERATLSLSLSQRVSCYKCSL